jgi:4a-hydroxytetrahydrobiopterin dehydratase
MAGGSMSSWSQRPDALERDFELDDFAAAMAFVNKVADAAEEADHHPDIFVHGWNKVRLTLSTHSEGGLTDKDHALARRIDELAGG